jgi:hypothetical protein
MARYTRKDWQEQGIKVQPWDVIVEDCGCEQIVHDTNFGKVTLITVSNQPHPVTGENLNTFVCADHAAQRVISQANAVKQQRVQAITQRLAEIDKEVGPRATREELLAIGRKGFGNKLETLENEAIVLRAELKTLA